MVNNFRPVGLGLVISGEEPPAKKVEDREGMSHGSHMIIVKAHCLKTRRIWQHLVRMLVNFRYFLFKWIGFVFARSNQNIKDSDEGVIKKNYIV